MNAIAQTQRYIGQILVRDLGPAPEQLEQALEKQREEGGLLGEILLAMKAIAEERAR